MADSNITVSGLLRLATNQAYMATGFQPMRGNGVQPSFLTKHVRVRKLLARQDGAPYRYWSRRWF
jgi:hypothetical protein